MMCVSLNLGFYLCALLTVIAIKYAKNRLNLKVVYMVMLAKWYNELHVKKHI